jgi:benzoyl-CoA reductase subunit A
MKVEYVVGVDLGSTTTKAVLLDENQEILGRGITNSRSNYDVACQVAMNEAIINARFFLLDRELARQGADDKAARQALAKFRRAFRLQQYLAEVGTLEGELRKAVEDSSVSGLNEVVDKIVASMQEEAPLLFAPGAHRKSDFFRDLAGGTYSEHADEISKSSGIPFDNIIGLFDKAILEVENTADAAGKFDVNARTALTSLGIDDPNFTEAVTSAMGADLARMASVGTGYGRARLPFEKADIRSEILCHGLGGHAMFPGTRTLLDIGGQDTKGIQVDERGIVTSFQMNDRCAAGCGRYLGYIADEMNLGLHQLGPLARKSKRKVRINSTCTVFAGAELRERLALGEKREDILAGLHRAIVLRAMSILARSGGVEEQFTFTGGVAKNPAAVDALKTLIFDNYGERTVNISADSIYTGAYGAAIFAHRSLSAPDAEEKLSA